MTLLMPTLFAHLNDAQQQAVQTSRDAGLTILAGAGTGKTEVIAARYVALYETLKTSGEEYPEHHLLVVTFTDKAARQMRRRIETHLRSAGLLAEGTVLDTPWIGTFHSICQTLLRQAAEENNRPVFQVIDPLDRRLKLKAWLSAIQQGLWSDISEALAAAELSELPANCLSPAALAALGLEETADLLAAFPAVLARIKAAGLTPRTFLEAATQQCTQWTDTLQALPLRDPLTQDPFGSLEEASQTWARHLAPWADADWTSAALEANREPDHYKTGLGPLTGLLKFNRRQNFYEPAPDAAQVLSQLSDCLKVEQRLIQTMAALYAFYQFQLAQGQYWDFDDLLLESVRLLNTHPTLRAQYQQQFHAILVDEFQDTNGSQLQLLLQLMHPEIPNVMVVGDEKQSVYGFRFAQKENLQLIFEQRDHQILPLQINYRSSETILSVANQVANLLTGNDPRHLLNPPPEPSPREAHTVEWATLGKHDAHGKPPPIEDLREQEAEQIADQVQYLLQTQGIADTDIAILARKHYKLARLEAALARRGIASLRQKQVGFFDRPEIKDAMALLQLMVTPHDDLAWVRLLQNRHTPAELAALMQHYHETRHAPSALDSLYSYLNEHPSYASQMAALRTAAQSRAPLPVTFKTLMSAFGLPVAKRSTENTLSQETAWAIFDMLLAKLSQPGGDTPAKPVADVLERLRAYREAPDIELPLDPSDGDEPEASSIPGVRLLTAHGAKGLEFPVVFLAWTDPPLRGALGSDTLLGFDPQFSGKAGFGLFLSNYHGSTTIKKSLYRQLWQKPRQEAEEKRLFYVALTRARERLFVYRAIQSPAWTDLKEG